MNEYRIRKAIESDILFLTEVVIAAEKSNSDKLSFSTLFNLSEEMVRELIAQMFEEEIDGCEFSLSSFLVVEYDRQPVAAFAGWIDQFNDEMPSKILKSNLIGFTFGAEAVKLLKDRGRIISDILIDREKGCLQLEYLFVNDKHRGKQLGDLLINEHIKQAKATDPGLSKVQVQLFRNNQFAHRLYTRCGFYDKEVCKANNTEIFQYLPFNEKLLMEKILTQNS